jgi:hypothetical protein
LDAVRGAPLDDFAEIKSARKVIAAPQTTTALTSPPSVSK